MNNEVIKDENALKRAHNYSMALAKVKVELK